MFNVILAQPRGFCAGVERAIDIVEKALEKFGAPIYVRHQIVHNAFVVKNLEDKGVVFVKELGEIPDGAITVFSAHGVSKKVSDEAGLRDMLVIDATCPLVTKVHNEAIRNEKQGKQIILIGHKNHPEVIGTSGRVESDVILVQNVDDVQEIIVQDESRLAYVTQTTLSVDDTKEIIASLRNRFPLITGPDTKDICYATQNRQNAIRDLAKQVDIILVVGAKNSSNSNRLRDLAESEGVAAYLIDSAKDIKDEWLINITNIGLSAGASAPEILVENVISYIKSKAETNVTTMDGKIENIKFKLPKELREEEIV